MKGSIMEWLLSDEGASILEDAENCVRVSIV
jgi:hypothetical protein